MNPIIQRSVVGMLAGAVASISLVATLGYPRSGVVLGILVGAAYAASLPSTRGAYVDNLMAAGALGVPLWGLISVIAFPLFFDHRPQWSADEMRSHFPALVGWILYASSLGVITQGLGDLADRFAGPREEASSPPLSVTKRIVVLGGGFAGMRTAQCLEEELRADPSVSLTLISETNALLFTPMLAEVAGSSLEPSHISAPLRSAVHRTEFIRGAASQIDLEKRRVILASAHGSDEGREIPYDHLVLALGSVSNYYGMANIEKFAFGFKTLLDAIRIRNHVIEMFERADRESDPEHRRELLTFVIAGGGFAGVELAGALNDFAHGILADYSNLRSEDLRIVLVHSGERILPELSESLGKYAQRKMEARGVSFRLGRRLKDAQPGVVVLDNGEIRAATLVWTAGTTPHPLLKSLPLERDKRGAVVVEDTFAVKNHSGLWALGDCASVNNGKTGKTCPPTAQFAIRQAAVLARNIRAQLDGRDGQAFHFDSLGALCVVGHQTACAELSIPFMKKKSLRFSGLLAWVLWRGIYLSKLPGIERKIRVLMDWTVELFFPRDIVQTIDLR